MQFIAIGIGATLGAWLRWGLGLMLNTIVPRLPLGTLAANLVGGFLMGLAAAFFAQHPQLSPQWRLLIVTGFLGGLTTFSSFSAESLGLLQSGDYFAALLHSVLHLIGSLVCAALGFALYQFFSRSGY